MPFFLERGGMPERALEITKAPVKHVRKTNTRIGNVSVGFGGSMSSPGKLPARYHRTITTKIVVNAMPAMMNLLLGKSIVKRFCKRSIMMPAIAGPYTPTKVMTTINDLSGPASGIAASPKSQLQEIVRRR
jgi:hypothetical protein